MNRVVHIHGSGDVRLDQVPMPVVGPNDVLVQPRAAGICGSDLALIKAGGLGHTPMPIGHEVAGDVVAVGDRATGVAVGDRVLVNPVSAQTAIGYGGSEGGFTDYLLVTDGADQGRLLPIPEEVDYALAALTEPLAVALHCVHRADLKSGERAVVYGAGPIGLGLILWLAEQGVQDIVSVDLDDQRLARARALGATHTINASRDDVRSSLMRVHGVQDYRGADYPASDVYFDAAGAPTVIGDVVQMAKAGARLLVVAVYSTPVAIDLRAMVAKELSITTAVGYPSELAEVLDFLPRFKARFDAYVSHRFPFARIIDAFSIAAEPGAAKVIVEFPQQAG